MSPAPTLHTLLQEALTQVPRLSRELVENTQDALDAKPQYFLLRDAWRRQRGRLTVDFEAALIPLLQTARRGEDPLLRRPGRMDVLSLVDEHQAQQDVAIAQVIQAIEEPSGVELHQLNNFFAALRGTARARSHDNPVRAALFAQALYQAVSALQLDAENRHELMRVAAAPLGQAMHRVYLALCEQLQAADLSQLVARHAFTHQDANARQRFADARRVTEPATFDGLARRVFEHSTRPQALSPTGAQQATPAFITASGPDMLSRLYDQILADPRLLPSMKALLARLQVAVVRLARSDTSLLRRQDHPTWQLLNRVAAHGMGFEEPNDDRLQGFLTFMDVELQFLIDTPAPSAAQFETVLKRVEKHISSQAQQRSERSSEALAALEREQMRPQWQQVVREQIDDMTAKASLGPQLRRFLQTSWVDVIVQAMVLHGRDSEQTLSAIELVDELLNSLQPLRRLGERDHMREQLPNLIRALRAGCESIGLPEPKREPMLQELMQQHARLLSGNTAPPVQAPQAAPATAPAPSDEFVQQLLTERESQIPEHWAHKSVDRGELPTVPVALYTQQDSPDALAALSAWVDGLVIGGWYHLFVQSEWLTAQVVWISETKQFYLFVGQDAEERHSLTHGALKKLRANGLITALEDRSVVQRAMDTLMQNMADATP